MERKIIFECRVGSHLYGTNRPESDEDFLGVFLPSTDDIFSLENCPGEWAMNEKLSTGPRNAQGDTDRKYYSVQKFLKLLGQGQPWAREMAFAPGDMWVTATEEWAKFLPYRRIFLSQNSIQPFIGFAKAQAYKATLKGDNLNLIRRLIEKINNDNANSIIRDLCSGCTANENQEIIEVEFLNEQVKVEQSQYRPGVFMDCIVIAGRKFEFTKKVKDVRNQLKELENRYGTRSEAAAEHGYDFKSLLHTYRLLGEAEELLSTGKMTLPRPPEQVALLKKIRAGEYEADFFQEIEDKLTEIRKIDSPLPKNVNWSKINELCKDILTQHLLKGIS
jgi:predicted nucleotidyltransferase